MINKPSVTPELQRLFVLTAKHRSISAAAREENLTPSLATRRIAQFEAALGVRLFERTTRSIQLTEPGAIALRWAEQALQAQAQVMDELSAVQREPTGLVRLVVTRYAAAVQLPGLLADFSSMYPKIRLAITTTDSLVNLVEARYDLALHSGRVPDSSVVGHRLYQLTRVLCATPAYLHKRGTPTVPGELADHDCLAHSVNEPRHWFFRHGQRLLSQTIEPFVEADDYTVLLELVRSSMGVARLALPLVKTDIDSGKLVQLMPQYKCVYPDGDLPGLWLLYPNRRVLRRTRLLIDHVSKNLKLTE